MGIMPTGAIYKTLTFDGKASSEFNVYITGEAVFNAPERAVEMISIPGRNGSFALDHGRFENIEVTYNCGIVADDETDFAAAISDFRNWLCSRNGYVRLTDDYNSGEYRMAMYKSGLEVETTQLIAGEFPIVFECKPQRFLTLGETAVAITSGDDITNPTLFDSAPLLSTNGYGDITLNGQTITIQNTQVGTVVVYNGGQNTLATTMTITIDDTYASVGDTISFSTQGATFETMWYMQGGFDSGGSSESISGTGVSGGAHAVSVDYTKVEFIFGNPVFSYGTSATISATYTGTFDLYDFTIETVTVNISLAYDGSDTFTLTATQTFPTDISERTNYRKIKFLPIYLDSSQLISGNTVYMDLDIGEVYTINNGEIVPLNDVVSLPAELPILPPGATTITYDNTITNFKITPRWWKV